MAKAAKQPTAKAKKNRKIIDIHEGVRLLELNPRGQYLFVVNQEQFTIEDTSELIDLCDKTAMTNVKGALIVRGDVNTAVKLIDIKDLKKEPAKDVKTANTPK